MLINNVNGDRVGASMVKNSAFYVEVAKFVQAYTTILSNPNVFLKEVGESAIDEQTGRLTWAQFSKIAQNCDLGFTNPPSNLDLIVYYNYALEIGSLDKIEKRLATIDDVADAQKHYYNFIDEAKDRAETEYLKQHRITENRSREVSAIDNKLAIYKTVNVITIICMMISVFFATFSIVSFFVDNKVVDFYGMIIPVWSRQYVGAIIMLVLAIIVFIVADKVYIWAKRNYVKLKQASEVIFAREDESYAQEEILKRKLGKVNFDLRDVENELKDREQKYDVKKNINHLKKANKYYKNLCASEEEFSSSNELSEKQVDGRDEEAFAPVKLTREQEENLHTVSKEAINLVGQFDEEAYNEKFEKSRLEKDENSSEKQEETEQKEEENQEDKKEEEQNQDLINSIDYIKDILGLGGDDQQKQF